MNQGFGGESPPRHSGAPLRPIARYLVVIDSGGSGIARLLLENRQQVEEFDAGAAEVAQMTVGLMPVIGAEGPEWAQALAGHSASERRSAAVYTLDV